MGDRQFEDYMAGGGGELFKKVDGLAHYLAGHSVGCLDALGYELLEGAAPRTTVRAPDGTIHHPVMMASNSFLDLARHPEVVAAAQNATAKYGYGMGAVSLYAGTSDLHRQLEQKLATFFNREAAILFPCGYTGNIGTISALCGHGDVIINDAANHASIFDGCTVAGAHTKIFLHGNMQHLERTLKRLPDSQLGRLIVTDGVFSMDGDLAKLDTICELAARYGARVMVDDAHGVGVVGPTGRGTPEVFGCLSRIDVLYGTLSKGPGGLGGYVVGSKSLINYLRTYARTYFFSTALPASVVAGLNVVFDLMTQDQAGRTHLWRNIAFMTQGLRTAGFDIGQSASAIIPVMIRDEEKLGRIHRELLEAGLFTNVVSYPAVRRKACRLRLNIMATHSQEDLNLALAALCRIGRQHGLIS